MHYIQNPFKTRFMKKIICLCLLFTASLFSFAQEGQEEENARRVVVEFFEAFHRQDSVALRNLAHPTIKMQSIATNEQGAGNLSTNTYSEFLNRIVSIPSTTKFEEKLHSFEVQVNGPLATVITPYSFIVNGNLSHCGVNSFTMVKEAEEWKIVYIIDTRSKTGCDTLLKKV